MFSQQELEAFTEVWVTTKHVGQDLHQVFADKLGCSRQEAKALAYKIGYSAPIVNVCLKSMKDKDV